MKFDTRVALLTCLATGVLLTGCATKRYAIATPVAPTEATLLNCRDITLELARADQIEKQIDETGKMDYRTVAGFLGDLGIGNGMAKEEARKALNQRRTGLRDLQVKKSCVNDAVPATAKP